MLELNGFVSEMLESVGDAGGNDFNEAVWNIVENNDMNSNILIMIIDIFEENKQIFFMIFMLGIVSMLINIIDKNRYKIANLIISLMIISILMAVFVDCCNSFITGIDEMISFYQVLCPVFFPAITLACGISSSAGYYEIVLFIIYLINLLIKNILFKVNVCGNLLWMIDVLDNKKRYSKMTELMDKLIRYCGKGIMIFIFGFEGVKGLILPIKDSIESKAVLKVVESIPGVGSSANAVSKQVLGTAVLVKNSIGVLSIIAILLLIGGPLIKIVIIAFSLKFLSAILQPISGDYVSNVIENSVKGINNLIYMMVISVSLLCITIAIICYSTNIVN